MPAPSLAALSLAALAPTLVQYSNWPSTAHAVNYNSTAWIACDGPFALCYLAQCGGVLPHAAPPQAACACDARAGPSQIKPQFTLSKPAAVADAAACYGGRDPVAAGAAGAPTPCAPPPAGAANAAPICAALAAPGALYGPPWPLVSTFAAQANAVDVTCTGAADGQSAYGNCMTAACARGGGGGATCYCPVTRVAPGDQFVVAYDGGAHPGGPPPGLCESTRLDGAIKSGRPVVVSG